MQIFSPLLFILLLILSFYDIASNLNSVLFAIDPKKSTNVSIGAQVEIGQDAAKEISKGIGDLGTNIGLAGSIGAVTAGVAKVVAKSTLPPVQKAGLVMLSSAIGAGLHLGTNAIKIMNRKKSTKYEGSSFTNTSTSEESIVNNVSENINKFIDDSINSPLKDLILSIDIINYACLSLIIILFMIILFKFYFNEENIKFNLSNFIGDKLNNNLNYYFIKIIQLNKRTSTLYIYIIFIVLFIGLISNCYFSTELYNNLDNFVEFHINSK